MSFHWTRKTSFSRERLSLSVEPHLLFVWKQPPPSCSSRGRSSNSFSPPFPFLRPPFWWLETICFTFLSLHFVLFLVARSRPFSVVFSVHSLYGETPFLQTTRSDLEQRQSTGAWAFMHAHARARISSAQYLLLLSRRFWAFFRWLNLPRNAQLSLVVFYVSFWPLLASMCGPCSATGACATYARNVFDFCHFWLLPFCATCSYLSSSPYCSQYLYKDDCEGVESLLCSPFL